MGADKDFRKELKKNTVVKLYEMGSDTPKYFNIKKRLGRGGSVISYEVHSGKFEMGAVLNEFYPNSTNAIGIERGERQQLVLPNLLQKEKEDFLKAYSTLYDYRKKNENLGNFFPNYEIYQTYNGDNKNGTIYIWHPSQKKHSFSEVCKRVHRYPRKDAAKKLSDILSIIEVLTKAVCELHKSGLLHRDLSPNNFGVKILGDKKKEKEIQYQNLLIYDINSICKVGTDGWNFGTPGFMEPEASKKGSKATNQSDIFSIGALLFYAIIVPGKQDERYKTWDFHYRPELYDQIDELVESSALISSIYGEEHSQVKFALKEILKKCLANRRNRYGKCEELLKDLGRVLALLPITRNPGSSKEWVLTDKRELLAKKNKLEDILAIQYHLFETPLYKAVPNSSSTIDMLLVGLGYYGQRFLDACLQFGQMKDRKLNVYVITSDDFDRESYLYDRPALNQFFDIDGSLGSSDQDSYGSIKFFDLEKNQYHGNLQNDIPKILQELFKGQSPHYMFIDIESEKSNATLVKELKESTSEFSPVISYISRVGERKVKDTYPILIDKPLKEHSLYDEMERMGMNVHLTWERHFNIDFKEAQKKYRDPYNRLSSISNVVSMKYKLASIGIDWDVSNAEDVAGEVYRRLQANGNTEMVDQLAWMEHKRWVTEKICLGWQPMTVEESVKLQSSKNTKDKKHICIVRSQPNRLLMEESRYWDQTSKGGGNLHKLDQLDQLSVDLHRKYRDIPEKVNTAITNPLLQQIQELSSKTREATVLFDEWYACIRDIMKTNSKPVLYRYPALRNALVRKIKEDNPEKILQAMDSFDRKFTNIINAKERHNWKKVDIDMVQNIPFILTYSQHIQLVVELMGGTPQNGDILDKVAAATVVNPEKVIYWAYLEKNSEKEVLENWLATIPRYFHRKNIRSRIEVFIYSEDEDLLNSITIENKNVTARLRLLKKKQSAIEDFGQRLIQRYNRSKTKTFCYILENNSKMASPWGALEDQFPTYRFDPVSIRFQGSILEYLSSSPYLMIQEMFELKGFSSHVGHQPEFFSNYARLWKKYSEDNGRTWKSLCRTLAKHSKIHEGIVEFNIGQSFSEDRQYPYALPVYCQAGVEKIIKKLKDKGYIEKSSTIMPYTVDSFVVNIVDKRQNKAQFDALFSNYSKLVIPEFIRIEDFHHKTLSIKFEDLCVRNLELPQGNRKDLTGLLNYFEKLRLINCLRIDKEGRVSFSYASRQLKDLFTVEGRMLEVYVYHKLKASNYFDHILSSVEISWPESQEKNEFDCILTKGFQTIAIECKSRSNLDQDMFHKFDNLTKYTTVKPIKVFVAETNVNLPNTNQLGRAKEFELNVVHDRDQIGQIDETVRKIIENKNE